MKVGDLVKPTATLWTDIGIVIGIEALGRRPEKHAKIQWSCGKVQWFDYELLEVISESR